MANKDDTYFTTSNGVSTKTQHLARQIESLRALNQNLVKQKEIQVAESTLAASDFNRQKQLHKAILKSVNSTLKEKLTFASQSQNHSIT